MATSKLRAFRKFVQYIHKHTDGEVEFNEWYAGISEQPKPRMSEGHNVADSGASRWYSVRSERAARKVEKQLLELGLDGADGGGDEDASHVYVYKKTRQTDP